MNRRQCSGPCKLVLMLSNTQKCFLNIIPRGIFEEAGDLGRGCDFCNPPYLFYRGTTHLNSYIITFNLI